MGARLGGPRGIDDLEVQHEINVTQCMDGMLVLCIIFMVDEPRATVDSGGGEDCFLCNRVGGLEAAMANRTTEDTVLVRITDSEVKAAVEALPENFRMPVLLADVEGFSYKEIADIMDVPIGTVMSRLHRGRRALQKALYDFGLERGLVEKSNAVNE